MSDQAVVSQNQSTIDKGMALVNSASSTDVNVKALQGKEIGLHILQLGMAEAEANRIQRLMKVVDHLESQIFNIEKLDRLTDSEKVERYSLAVTQVGNSANFIKTTVNNINWTAIEVQLLSLAQGISTATTDPISAMNKRGMAEVATALMNQLASEMK